MSELIRTTLVRFILRVMLALKKAEAFNVSCSISKVGK
jgi:hypothetical protein